LRNVAPFSPGSARSVTTKLSLGVLAYDFAVAMLSASSTIASHARRTSLKKGAIVPVVVHDEDAETGEVRRTPGRRTVSVVTRLPL